MARKEENERVPGGIVPEGLVKRLDTMVTWEPADSPRAAALREAADVLRKLPTRFGDAARLEDGRFEAKGYRIDSDDDEKQLRLVFYSTAGQRDVLAYMLLDSAEAYEYATAILKNYDRMEGIK